ncbi:MerR family transcriptional regulator [Peribacillus sp. NPDC097895]|uniref:MerR family transcriptional regulator n=1 Tax=Peribacillus sp. NPDC097895 TaxID=3390619 RepID=UPI003D034BAA
MILNKKYWKVGELAKQTGLTVRMLHHYDKIGLFSPSQYSDTGHRLYTDSDIARLQQILSLKQLGFALEEVKEIMENRNFNPVELIKVQLDDVKKRIRLQELLRNRLENIYELINSQQEVTPEQFINLIEVINMNKDKYFTQEQQQKMFEQLGLDKRKQYVSEWAELTTKIRVEYEKGTPPENPDVTHLAKRWNEFIKKLTIDDPDISKAAERYYKENPEIGDKFGLNDKQFSDYIKNAISNI